MKKMTVILSLLMMNVIVTSGQIFTEAAESEFKILSKRGKNDFTYKSVESNFKPVSIQIKKSDVQRYFANIITTTEKSTGAEGQKRNIKLK